ncbi:MAG: phasin family protein [Chitinophagales bacterium]|nr:phasin family protein [Bacteroidota bacterium]MCB9042808.1 phasin family protein [Chitinophagales bacterium]
MEDLVKKLLYTGVGLVAATTEKVQTMVNDLVDKDKLKQEEGKRIVDDFIKSTENKKDEFEGKMKDLVESVVKKLNVVTREDVNGLSKRIEDLETELTKMTKAAAKAAKTTTTK